MSKKQSNTKGNKKSENAVPGNCVVFMTNGGTKLMAQLSAGDSVLSVNQTSSVVVAVASNSSATKS